MLLPRPEVLPAWYLTGGLLLALASPRLALPVSLLVALVPGTRISAYAPALGLGTALGTLRGLVHDPPPLRWDRDRTGWSHLEGLRGRLRSGLAPLSPRGRELTSALVLGDPLSRERRRTWSRSGILHLAAQSGLHVGLLARGVSALARPLPGSLGFALALGAALGYSILSGSRPGALRAVGMLALAHHAGGRGFRSGALGCLLGVVLVLVVWDPGLLLRLDFQLSAAATLGLALLARPLAGRLEVLAPRLPAWLRELAAASLAACLGTLPAQILILGEVPLLAPLVNLVAVPLGSLLLAASCLATGAGLLGDLPVRLAGVAVEPLAWLLDGLATAAAGLPVVAVPPVGPWTSLAVTLAILALALAGGEGWTPEDEAPPRRGGAGQVRSRSARDLSLGCPRPGGRGPRGCAERQAAASSASSEGSTSPSYMRSQIWRSSVTENRM